MSVPFKENVGVAIIASNYRRDHRKRKPTQTRVTPPWLRPSKSENALSQTTTTTTRPRPILNAKNHPPRAKAQAALLSRPPPATSFPVSSLLDPHASSNPHQTTRMPTSSLVSARNAAIVPARSHFARFASTSAAQTSSSANSPSLASYVTAPSLFPSSR